MWRNKLENKKIPLLVKLAPDLTEHELIDIAGQAHEHVEHRLLQPVAIAPDLLQLPHHLEEGEQRQRHPQPNTVLHGASTPPEPARPRQALRQDRGRNDLAGARGDEARPGPAGSPACRGGRA